MPQRGILSKGEVLLEVLWEMLFAMGIRHEIRDLQFPASLFTISYFKQASPTAITTVAHHAALNAATKKSRSDLRLFLVRIAMWVTGPRQFQLQSGQRRHQS
jgi:hypothetical protein